MPARFRARPTTPNNANRLSCPASDYEEWTDSDKVFAGIFSGCVEHASECALAQSQPDATAEELEAQAWAALEGLKEEPVVLNGSYILDYSALKGFVQGNLYGMDEWPTVALVFDRLFVRDEEALTELLLGATLGAMVDEIEVARSALRNPSALLGIHCGERTVRASSYEEIRPAADKLLGMSRIIADASSITMMTCARWEIEARERYEGGFDVRTKEPVLIIGNTYDAHTSIVSARNVSSGFEGSALLEVNGYGVCAPPPPQTHMYTHTLIHPRQRTTCANKCATALLDLSGLPLHAEDDVRVLAERHPAGAGHGLRGRGEALLGRHLGRRPGRRQRQLLGARRARHDRLY